VNARDWGAAGYPGIDDSPVNPGLGILSDGMAAAIMRALDCCKPMAIMACCVAKEGKAGGCAPCPGKERDNGSIPGITGEGEVEKPGTEVVVLVVEPVEVVDAVVADELVDGSDPRKPGEDFVRFVVPEAALLDASDAGLGFCLGFLDAVVVLVAVVAVLVVAVVVVVAVVEVVDSVPVLSP